VYAAEQAFIAQLKTLKRYDGLRMERVPDIQAWVDKILESHQWKTHFTNVIYANKVEVKDGRGRRRAGGGMWEISLPKWARDKVVALHELTHSAVARKHPRAAAHGHEFCKIFLMLVKRWIGQWEHDALKAWMRTKRVKFSPPRQSNRPRRISPAQQAALKRGRAALARKRVLQKRMAASEDPGRLESSSSTEY